MPEPSDAGAVSGQVGPILPAAPAPQHSPRPHPREPPVLGDPPSSTLGCSRGRGAIPAAGTSHPSARLGDRDPPGGLGDIVSPACPGPGETPGSTGEGSGCLFTSSTHARTHVCTRVFTPQLEPLIPLLRRIAARQPAPLGSLPVHGQTRTRRFPSPPPPGCQPYHRRALIDPAPLADASGRAAGTQAGGRTGAPAAGHGFQLRTRPVRLGQAGLGPARPEKPRQRRAGVGNPQPARLPRRHAPKLGSGSKPRALRSEYARAKASGAGARHPARSPPSRPRAAPRRRSGGQAAPTWHGERGGTHHRLQFSRYVAPVG